MKADCKKERRPSLLKRSIAASILLTVFLILSGIMIFLRIFIGNIISGYAEKYYTNIGELVAMLVSDDIKYYQHDLTEYFESLDAQELRKLSGKYSVYSLWLETSEPPYEKAENLIYLPISDIVLNTEHNPHQEFETQWPEREIFLGNADHGVIQYKSSHGVDIISYIHGVYDDEGNCFAVIGMNFDKDSIRRDIGAPVARVGVIVFVTFIGLMTVLGLFLHFAIFKPLRKVSDTMRVYVSDGALKRDKLTVKGEDELSQVASAYNKMTDDICQYVTQLEKLEKERLKTETEMNVAAQIQSGMLPPGTYNSGSIQIEALMRPAKEVGGDFYDYLILPDGKVFFCIADVSDKGISAAIFMAEAENIIRYYAALYSSPAKIMNAANNELCSRNPEQLFVTVFAAIYDPASGKVTFCNAGHDPAYLTGVGSSEMIKGTGDLLLGVFPDENYTDTTIDIVPGNTLFLYTDGLTEAVNPDRTMFGKERMEEELERYASDDADSSLIGRMIGSVKDFTAGAPSHDDLTMLTIRFGKSLVLPARTDENMTLRKFLLDEERLTESEKKKICLAAEEIFVNICYYAYNSKESGTVWIYNLIKDNEYILTFADKGIPYNPLADTQNLEEYNLDEQIGGLGKLLSFTIMDRQEYEYRKGFNILTLKKSLKGTQGESL